MKHKNTTRQYAFLMVDYETNEYIKDIQDKIKEEELYFEDDNDDYGLETNPHVTLVPCLDNDVDLEKLKTYLDDLSEYDIILTDLSKFECDKFDVLKCTVKSEKLKETNKKILKDFEMHSEYKVYQPHLTIAYMKQGMADKYLKKILPKLIHLKPKNFHFSYVDENGNEKEITFE
jgi:2'-5' RNA ligase